MPKRNALATLAVSISVFIIFFGLIEAGCRLFWNEPEAPKKPAVHQILAHPNGRDEVFEVQPDDALGYRIVRKATAGDFTDSSNRSFSIKKSSNVFRIVCLGGSTTYGTGADSLTYSYPGDLQRIFKAAFPDCPRRVEVINAGEMGYHSWHSLLRAEIDLDGLNPDLYLVMDGLNDVAEVHRIRDMDELKKEEAILTGLINPPKSLLERAIGSVNRTCEHLAFYRFLRASLNSLRPEKLTPKDYRAKMDAFGYSRNMAALAKGRRAKGIEVQIVNYPWIVKQGLDWRGQLDRLPFPANRDIVELYSFGREYVSKANRDLADSGAVGLIDPQILFDALIDGGEPIQRLYSSDLVHLTNRANYLLARQIFEKLLQSPKLAHFLGGCASRPLLEIDSLPFSQHLINWGKDLVPLTFEQALKAPCPSQRIDGGKARIAKSDFNDWTVYEVEGSRGQTLTKVALDGAACKRLAFFPRLANYGDAISVTLKTPGAPDVELFHWEKMVEDGVWSTFGAAYAFDSPSPLPPGATLAINLTGHAQVYGKNGSLFFAAPPLCGEGKPGLTRPTAFEILQKNKAGVADIPFGVMLPPGSGLAEISLYAKDGENPLRKLTQEPVACRIDGSFKDVKPGLYRICVTSGVFHQCRETGVGSVFLVAGQSNVLSVPFNLAPPASKTGLVSVNIRKEEPDPDLLSDPDFHAFIIPTPNRTLQANACWIICGDLLAEHFKEPIGFVNVATSNTSSELWKPDGRCFSHLEAALKARPYAAVLWGQGESDIIDKLPEETSYRNMKGMIEASRAIRLGIPWIVALDSLDIGVPYDELPVRRAQRRILAEGLALQGPDMDRIRENKSWVGVADFGGGGILRVGELWYEPLAAFLEKANKTQ